MRGIVVALVAAIAVMVAVGPALADSQQEQKVKAWQREQLCTDIQKERPYGPTKDDDVYMKAIAQYCSEYWKARGVKYPK